MNGTVYFASVVHDFQKAYIMTTNDSGLTWVMENKLINYDVSADSGIFGKTGFNDYDIRQGDTSIRILNYRKSETEPEVLSVIRTRYIYLDNKMAELNTKY